MIWPVSAFGQLEISSLGNPQYLFCGGPRNVLVTVHNLDTNTAEADLSMRLFQISSATATPLNELAWKRVRLLGGQTVMDSVALSLAPVTAQARFLVCWTDSQGKVLGRSELMVYPQGLLKDFKTILEDQSMGVFDPQNQLKPLLKDAGVEIVDLEAASPEEASIKLAVIGPFLAQKQMPGGMAGQIKKLVEKGVAVVWLQPPQRGAEPMPSFYAFRQANGVVVVVENGLVANLSDNPKSQLNLIRFATLALHPKLGELPFLQSEQ